MLVKEDHSYIYAFVLILYLLTSGITWGIIAYMYDEAYKVDRLLIILMHTTNVVVVTNIVENRLKQMFRPFYLFLIPLHIGTALGFRKSGSIVKNISFNFNHRIGILSIIILCLLLFTAGFHFWYHFVRYKKNKLGLVYFSFYLCMWILFVGLAYVQNHPLHLHHYALALMCSYGFTAKHPIFIIALTISLAIMNEGIATWGAGLLYEENPSTFYLKPHDEYKHLTCESSNPFKFVFLGRWDDYTDVTCYTWN